MESSLMGKGTVLARIVLWYAYLKLEKPVCLSSRH